MEDAYAGYKVVDRDGEKIGKVDDLFVDENDRPEHIGVKMGFLGTRSTHISAEITRSDEARETVEVAAEESHAKDGPTFEDDREITPELEAEVLRHYGLEGPAANGESVSYGAYGTDETTTGAAVSEEHELRGQRSEEKLVAGTREREAGSVKVRKRVRTDRERIEVPTRHEEVSVERVPVSGVATGAQIGEDEVEVAVTEEEVVTDKRVVAREEVRLRKDVVEGTSAKSTTEPATPPARTRAVPNQGPNSSGPLRVVTPPGRGAKITLATCATKNAAGAQTPKPETYPRKVSTEPEICEDPPDQNGPSRTHAPAASRPAPGSPPRRPHRAGLARPLCKTGFKERPGFG